MDIAQLGFEVDTKQLEKAVGLLERLEKGGSGNGIIKIQQDIEKMNRSIQSAMGFMQKFIGTLVSIQTVRGLAKMADEWSDMTSLVKVNIGATEDATAVMNRLAGVARTTYSSLSDTAQAFAANATTLRALGKTTQEQLDYTSALNNALVVSGAKGQQFAQVQDALSKAMATGALRGIELNTVLGRGSAVAEALADELGVSRLRLQEMGAQGKITGDVIFSALTKRMEELEERAESMPMTMADGFTLIRNSVLQAVGAFDKASGSSESFAEILKLVADAIGIVASNVDILFQSYGDLDAEQEAVAISAEDIAHAMKTVVTGVVIAKNTIDVLIDGFKLAGRMAGTLAAAMVDAFTKSFTAFQRLVKAMTPGSGYSIADAIRDNMADLSGIVERTMDGLSESTGEFWESYEQNVADVARAFEFLDAPARQAAGAIEGTASAATTFGAEANGAAAAAENLYTNLTKIFDVTGDVDDMLRSMTYSLADSATRALMDYEAVQARILELEMAWLDLGPMSAEQIDKLAKLRSLAAQQYERELDDMGSVSERVARDSARAWQSFADGLADAVLRGSRGVKDYFKRLLDDLKRQIIASGLLNLFRQIFNVGGANTSGFASLLGSLGGGTGVGFGSILQLAGGLGGGTGGSLLSGLAGAISGGIANGLMSLGGGLAGLGMGGLGGGLAWAGGSVAANGLIGGLGGSFMTGLGNLFGAGGGALMGIGQMIPAIAAIAGVAAAIQKISGGKLFGTSYGFDSAGRTLDFSATGASGQDRLTEVRQRSLFRGRRWRDTYSELPDDVADSIGQFWDQVAMSNIAIAGDAARTIGAQIRQEFDAEGNVTSTIVEVIGRQYRESLEEAMTRIAAENVIANIDAMLGTTVTRTSTGPGQIGPGGGGRSIDDLLPVDTIIKATQQVGEAFAIAERWRHDADLLAEGAQMLLLAATDIKAGAGLLGDGSLTAVADLIEGLAFAGEPLADAYVRVATSAALLDQALALSGVQIDGTREHIVRLATDITTAAGGLERASALWSNYFDRFYTDAERAQFALTQAQASATKEFGDIGLNYADFTSGGGMAEFRRLFEAALPTLSAEAIVEWLEAAAALGIVIDATDALNAALGEVGTAVGQTADQLAAVNDILDGNAWDLLLAGMTDAEAAIARINHQYDQQRAELLANAATLEQLTTLESQRAAALANQQAALLAQRASITGNMQRDIDRLGMTDYQREIAGIHEQRQAYIDSLVSTGMSLAQATVATRAWRDAMLGAAAAAEAARQQQLLAQRASITGNMQRDIDQLGMTDYQREIAGIHAQRQQYIASLVETGMTLSEATIATREWRDAMIEAAESARAAEEAAEAAQRAASIADVINQINTSIADLDMTPLRRQLDAIAVQAYEFRRRLIDAGMAVEDATAHADRYANAMRANAIATAEAAEAAEAAARAANIAGILDGNAWTLYLDGLSEGARAVAEINRRFGEQRDALTLAGASSDQLETLESQRIETLRRLAAAQAEVAAIEAQRARQTVADQMDADVRDAYDRVPQLNGDGPVDDVRSRLFAIAHAAREYQEELLAAGGFLPVVLRQVREYREQMENALRFEIVNTALATFADDIAAMNAELASMGMSDYAVRQMQIAAETQEALAVATAAGATPAQLLAIEIKGIERAAIAAALAAANLASDLADWEFEDYLAGLSEADAQRARVDRQWEERYNRAVEIFGAGSAEAIRVLGLWDSAIGRLSNAAVQATEAMQRAAESWSTVGETNAKIVSFAAQLAERIAHLRIGDAMDAWLSELSGLPKLAQQAVRRPLAEVAALVRDEYITQAEDLQQQIDAAHYQLSRLPWYAQAEAREIEGRIASLQNAIGSITGQMGSALDTLKRMYIASLQGVRDYLDSMLLGDLSALTPAERIAEAWSQLQAAVEAGEGDAATRLADTYLRLLREFEASGDDYNAGFYAVRELLEGMLDIDWDALLGPDAAGATDSDNIAHMAGTVDAQLAAAQAANDWLAQIAANTGGWGLPSYDVGTYNVPQTGPAILHAGEMVLPRPMADAMRQGAFGGGGDTKALEAKLDGVIQRLDKLDRTTATGAQQVAATVAKTGEISDRNADASRARHAQAQRRGVTA